MLIRFIMNKILYFTNVKIVKEKSLTQIINVN